MFQVNHLNVNPFTVTCLEQNHFDAVLLGMEVLIIVSRDVLDFKEQLMLVTYYSVQLYHVTSSIIFIFISYLMESRIVEYV